MIAPAARTDGTLNEYALGDPMCGCPSRLKTMRSIAFASVTVPTVERGFEPIRSWSTMIAVVSPSSRSTSGRDCVGMKPCTKALYVSLMRRCDSAAIVPNTSELLPEPETPVNTVSRRFGISTLTSFRLFTRAPRTRIRSWLSARARCDRVELELTRRAARRCSTASTRAKPLFAPSSTPYCIVVSRSSVVAKRIVCVSFVRVAQILELERLQVILECLHEPLGRVDLAELALDDAVGGAEAVRAARADVHLLDHRAVAPPFRDPSC